MIRLGVISICGLAAIAIAGCTAQTDPLVETAPASTYGPPSQSGLVAGHPNDVCKIIGENGVTVNYLDHTTLLIGCPEEERGTIADKIRDGAARLEQIGAWVLLSVSN